MYPKHFIDLFPPFPKSNRVFVAMPFSEEFTPRYSAVLEPAIRSIQHEGADLEPFRVDARNVSDSILTEVLTGVTDALLVICDITSEANVGGRAYRNGNVMYEVGIAHTCRLPEEVLLFRSDNDRLLFDVTNIRVNQYDPDGNPGDARVKVADAITGALAEVDLTKNRAVRKAAESVDQFSYRLLGQAFTAALAQPDLRTAADNMAAGPFLLSLSRLLDLGAIKAVYPRITADNFKAEATEPFVTTYLATPFGQALYRYLSWSIANLDDKELLRLLAEHDESANRSSET